MSHHTGDTTGPTPGGTAEAADPGPLVRSRAYAGLLLLSALVGLPVSAVAFGFLAAVDTLQRLLRTDLPHALGLHPVPLWWPVPLLALGGALTALCVTLLPGRGGHEPSEGFTAGGPPPLAALPGILLAAVATLATGAVLGPEAPLIALGGGLAAAAVRPGRRADDRARTMLGGAGSFAAVSALLGSPLLGAFLLMEVAEVSGPLLGAVLVPGLLAAGVGSLVFTGLGSWTGLGTYGLTLPHVPDVGAPTAGEFGWALLVGVGAAVVVAGGRVLSRWWRRRAESRRTAATVTMGLTAGGLAVLYAWATGHDSSEVLYSGQSALGPLLAHSASYSAGALVLLLLCKALAYAACLGGFRGGPIFPSMFLGAAGGMALSHLPGLPVAAGFAMGVGATTVAMLRLPMTSLLLATLLLGHKGLTVMPLVIVAVVVAYVTTLSLPEAVRGRAGARRGALRRGAA